MWVYRNFEGLHKIEGVARPLVVLSFLSGAFSDPKAILQSVNLVCELMLLSVYPLLNLCDCIKGLSNSCLSNIAACVYVFYIVYCQLNGAF